MFHQHSASLSQLSILLLFKVGGKIVFANQEISANRLKWRSSRPEVFALWHGCSPVNLLHITRTSFPKNTSVRLLLKMPRKKYIQNYLH